VGNARRTDRLCLSLPPVEQNGKGLGQAKRRVRASFSTGTGFGSHRHPDSENRVLVKVGVMDWPVVLIPTDELRNQRRVPVRGFRRYIYAVNELG
jgi:hypothetical protein